MSAKISDAVVIIDSIHGCHIVFRPESDGRMGVDVELTDMGVAIEIGDSARGFAALDEGDVRALAKRLVRLANTMAARAIALKKTERRP